MISSGKACALIPLAFLGWCACISAKSGLCCVSFFFSSLMSVIMSSGPHCLARAICSEVLAVFWALMKMNLCLCDMIIRGVIDYSGCQTWVCRGREKSLLLPGFWKSCRL